MYWSGSKEGELMSSKVVRFDEDNDVVSGEEDIEGSGE